MPSAVATPDPTSDPLITSTRTTPRTVSVRRRSMPAAASRAAPCAVAWLIASAATLDASSHRASKRISECGASKATGAPKKRRYGAVSAGAATLGESLALASKYLFVHSPALRLGVEPVPGRPDEADLVFAIDLPHLPPTRQVIELSLAFVARSLGSLSGGRSRPLAVLMPHARGADKSRYVEVLGCPCRFEADCAAVRIRASVLQLPTATNDPLVREMAQTYLARQFGVPDEALSARVQLLLRRLLGTGRPTRERVAEVLAIHPSTLQRRLAGGMCHGA